jgi:DNA-binding Lrp family transcriptional regulator
MTTGFVLLKIKENNKQNVYKLVTQSPNINEIHHLFGEYDLIIKINAETTEHLGTIILDTLQSLEGITETKTMISVL